MQQILSFFFKNKHFLLFLLLELIAVIFTIQSHSFHKSKFINSANFITGGIFNKINNVKEFILLKKENARLAEENVKLKNISNLQGISDSAISASVVDTTNYYQKYSYIAAKVINNEFRKSNNYLTLNKGTSNGIKSDLGVVNSKGIVGITKSTSKRYTTVLSVLNVNYQVNVRLLRSDHFGSLSWDNKDYRTVQLLYLPVQASIKIGDTLITGGKSTIFPEGIPVGTIKSFNTNNNNYENINVTLFNDMSALSHVEIIDNLDRKEIKNLEEKSSHE
jgi:rod shape-determining protein MreC